MQAQDIPLCTASLLTMGAADVQNTVLRFSAVQLNLLHFSMLPQDGRYIGCIRPIYADWEGSRCLSA
jgi:hypothetical protein